MRNTAHLQALALMKMPPNGRTTRQVIWPHARGLPLAILCMLGFQPAVGAQHPEPPVLHAHDPVEPAQLQQAIGFVEGGAKSAPTAIQGVGFFVDEQGTFVTCAHVLEGCEQAFINCGRYGLFTVSSVLVYDDVLDLAIVRTDQSHPPLGQLQFASARPFVGSAVTVQSLGPSGAASSVHTVVASYPLQTDYEAIKLSNAGVPGMSGAPVLDSAGMVFGIVTSGSDRDPTNPATMLLPAKVIRSALDSALVATPLQEWWAARGSDKFLEYQRLTLVGLRKLADGANREAFDSFASAASLVSTNGTAVRCMMIAGTATLPPDTLIRKFTEVAETSKSRTAYAFLGAVALRVEKNDVAARAFRQAQDIRYLPATASWYGLALARQRERRKEYKIVILEAFAADPSSIGLARQVLDMARVERDSAPAMAVGQSLLAQSDTPDPELLASCAIMLFQFQVKSLAATVLTRIEQDSPYWANRVRMACPTIETESERKSDPSTKP